MILTSIISCVIYIKSLMERMLEGLKNLTLMEYPGRVIIIGQDRNARNDVVIYAITGRSPSSQARKLVKESHAIWARPTDEETIKKGNLDLLVYPAIMISGGIAVGNGRQTPDIKAQMSYSKDPVEVLSKAIQNWDTKSLASFCCETLPSGAESPIDAAKRLESGAISPQISQKRLSVGQRQSFAPRTS